MYIFNASICCWITLYIGCTPVSATKVFFLTRLDLGFVCAAGLAHPSFACWNFPPLGDRWHLVWLWGLLEPFLKACTPPLSTPFSPRGDLGGVQGQLLEGEDLGNTIPPALRMQIQMGCSHPLHTPSVWHPVHVHIVGHVPTSSAG